MNEHFDPYNQWLQIAPRSGRPNHYELLGLPLFAADPERIHAAYRDRHGEVRKYDVGGQEDLAQQILEELSLAFQCLSNPARKQAYDAQLRRQVATRETQAEAAITTQHDAVPESPADDEPPPAPEADAAGRIPVSVSWPPPTPHSARRPQPSPLEPLPENPWPTWLVLGAAVAAAGGCLLLIGLLVFAGRSAPPEFQAAAEPGAEVSGPSTAPAAADPVDLTAEDDAEGSETAPPSGTAASPSSAESEAAGGPNAPPKPVVASPLDPKTLRPGQTIEWTGRLYDIRATLPPASSSGASPPPSFHLLATSLDGSPMPAVPAVEAVAEDLLLLRELADYTALSDGLDRADVVVLTGVLLEPAVVSNLWTNPTPVPRLALATIQKRGEPDSLVAAGRRRDLAAIGLDESLIRLACQLRASGLDVTFRGTLVDVPLAGSTRPPDTCCVQVEGLPRRVAVRVPPGLPSSVVPGWLPGQQLQVSATVTDQSLAALREEARFKVLAGTTLQAAGAAPADVAGNVPSPAPPPSAAQDAALDLTQAANHARPTLRLIGHSSAVAGLVWSADGKCLVSAAASMAAFWDMSGRTPRSGEPLVHPSFVQDLACCQGSNLLVTRAADGGVRLWRSGAAQAVALASGRVVVNDNALAVVESSTGRLRVYVGDAVQPLGSLPYRAAYYPVATDPQARYLAYFEYSYGNSPYELRIVRWSEPETPLHRIELAGPPLGLAWRQGARDAQRLAAYTGRDLSFWQISDDGATLSAAQRIGVQPSASSPSRAPSGGGASSAYPTVRYPASYSYGTEMGPFREISPQIAWSPDGRWLVLPQGSERQLRDLAADRRFALPGGTEVRDTAFSPDSRYLAALRADGTVQVFALEETRLQHTLAACGPAAKVAVAPESGRVAVGHADGTISLWDLSDADADGAAEPRARASREIPSKPLLIGELRTALQDERWQDLHAAERRLLDAKPSRNELSHLMEIKRSLTLRADTLLRQALRYRAYPEQARPLLEQVQRMTPDSDQGKSAAALLKQMP